MITSFGSKLDQNVNGGCHWQAWKGQKLGWEKSSARKELSLLLLHRIHELQQIDFDHVEEALSCRGKGDEYPTAAMTKPVIIVCNTNLHIYLTSNIY